MYYIDSGKFLYYYLQNIQTIQVKFLPNDNGPLHDGCKYREGPFDDRNALFCLQICWNRRYTYNKIKSLQDQINSLTTQ
jgi:hypothetical protein